MHRLCGSLFSCLLLCAFLVGCDDQQDDTSTCSGISAPCERLDQQRCNGPYDGFEVCVQDGEGCLHWTADESCSERQYCAYTDGEPGCRCDDECTVEGETYCRGSLIVVCLADDNGCLYLERERDCEDTNQQCDGMGGPAECVGCIEHGCEQTGVRRCNADGETIELCARQADGCREWEEAESCAGDEECVQTGFRAECVTPCSDRCSGLGDSRCDAFGNVERCRAQADGCLDWEDGDVCDGAFEYCLEAEGEALCMACANECETPDETRCIDDINLETCVADEETGCLAWGEPTDCSPLSCRVEEETAGCVELVPGDSCLDAMAVAELPYTLEGEMFTDDFTDTLELTDESCESRPASSEVVLLVSLEAEQTLLVRELGVLDVVVTLQEASCGGMEACLISTDSDEDEATGHRYTAAAAVELYVIIETDEEAPAATDYEIRLDLVVDEVCDDDEDNDFDDTVDCADEDCADFPACAT